MRLWGDNRLLIKGLGVAVLALLAMKFTVVNWQTRAEETHAAKLTKLNTTLEEQRKGPYDIAEAVKELSKSNMDLDGEVKGLMKRVEIPFHPWTEIPPAYEGDPGAYFALKHAEQLRELDIICQVGAAGNPAKLSDRELGFGKILKVPLDTKGAQENLNRLSIVRRLVELLAKAGVAEIVSISPGDPVKTGPPGYAEIMREYPVGIRARTRIDPLMKFLHSVRRPGEFFLVVRGLDVIGFDPYAKDAKRKEVDEKELMVAITAAGMRFFSEEERKAAPKRKPKREKIIKEGWGEPKGY